jgi:putative oxidoreductase
LETTPVTRMKYFVLLGRLLFAAVFVMAAPILPTPESVQSAGDHGVPWPGMFVSLAGIIAVTGGLSVALGYKGRLGAWLLIVFLAPVTLAMHNFWIPDPAVAAMEQTMFLKNLALMGGALFITYYGTGPLSLDALLRLLRIEGKAAETARPELAGM